MKNCEQRFLVKLATVAFGSPKRAEHWLRSSNEFHAGTPIDYASRSREHLSRLTGHLKRCASQPGPQIPG